MRRIMYVLFATICAIVLLFSYHTSTQPRVAAATGTRVVQNTVVATAAETAAAEEYRPLATTSGTGGSGSGATTATTGPGKTYDGGVVQTRWGPVQVRITVADGKISSAEALQYPDGDGHSSQISSYAIPTLNQQAVTAQSAQLDGVSGATYTTDGYEQSLQSAIDAAGV